MLNSVARRIARLEQAIPKGMTPAMFKRRVEEHARVTGMSIDDAMHSIISSLSADEIDGLIPQLQEIVFGR